MYRFAPSVTKELTLNDIKIALFNFISSKQSDKKFIIRFDDRDIKKDQEIKDREILELLQLFGITYDEVLYQSNNLKFHRQLASKLLMDGNAFTCFCTPEIIETKKEQAKQKGVDYKYDETCKKLSDAEVMANEKPFVVRIKKLDDDKNIDDFVILKVDKRATHNFANSIDDMLSGISVVIDKKEITNIQKQELIREYLGFDEKIEYILIPTIEDDITIKELLENGYLPEAIANFLINPKKIFKLDESLEWFDIKNISSDALTLDKDALNEINRKHIKLLPPLELAKLIGYSSKDIGELAKIYTAKSCTINEIKAKIDTIFSQKTLEDFGEKLEELKTIAKELPYFKEFDEFKNTLKNKSTFSEKDFDRQLRVLLTGALSGPSLDKIYPHIKNYLGEIIR